MPSQNSPTWSQLTVDIPDALVELAVGELAGDCAGVHEVPVGSLTRLSFFFPPDSDLDGALLRMERFLDAMGLGVARLEVGTVEDRDWTAEWKRSLQSFPIGARFMIVPSWVQFPDSPRTIIHLDPGRAFGTGTHESTQLSVELLETWLRPGAHVLDVGTGSGILAIGAHKLGAGRTVGCDVDPEAIEVAAGNLGRNDAGRVELFVGSADAVETSSMDLVLANLTADLIHRVFNDMDRAARPEGIVILSGMLVHQTGEIREVAGPQYDTLAVMSRGEWAAIAIQKHGRLVHLPGRTHG